MMQLKTIVTSTTDSLLSTPRKRKRGEYNNLDEEQRAKIGRLAVEDGVARATRRFMTNSGIKVSESTVRSIRDRYLRARKASGMS